MAFKYKEFRRAHGIFQSQLAEIMGVVQSNISRYESENIEPQPEQLKKLYDKYGKEDVDSYFIEDTNIFDVKSSSKGSNGQNNCILVDKDIIEILKKQSDILVKHIIEQDKINARLMTVIENLSIK